MTYATTFSGIGGWECGLDACGWHLQWQCECEPFCQTLLRERFGVPIYGDIRTLADDDPPKVDALIGSPPCQPFSVAGAQRGTGDERHLYPSFIRAVGVLQPRWVLMEQVPAILSLDGGRAFGGYVGGLAALGYDLVWHCVPACAVGAPHRRDRLWIIAHHDGLGRQDESIGQPGRGDTAHGRDDGEERTLAHTDRARSQRWNLKKLRECSGQWPVRESSSFDRNADNRKQDQEQEISTQNNPYSIGVRKDVSDTTGREQQSSGAWGDERRFQNETLRCLWDSNYWLAEPSVGRVANGVPRRVDRLKGLGNAVVPQIPYLIGQAINEVENSPDIG